MDIAGKTGVGGGGGGGGDSRHVFASVSGREGGPPKRAEQWGGAGAVETRLSYGLAEVAMDIAGRTLTQIYTPSPLLTRLHTTHFPAALVRADGMGNFRFGSASNMVPGIPYFPVACCGGPQQHRTFAIGTEADALLHQAFAAAAAAAVRQRGGNLSDTAAAGAPAAAAAAATTADVQQLARQELSTVLLQHFAPVEAAAMRIQQQYAEQQTAAAAAAGIDSCADRAVDCNISSGSSSFRYLGLDTSLAPGLDTPAVTDSYELLLRHLNPHGTKQHSMPGGCGELCLCCVCVCGGYFHLHNP